MPEISQNAIKATNGTGTAISLTPASNTCTANITNNLSNRNLVVNGSFIIAQRAQAYTGDQQGYQTVDRFKIGWSGADSVIEQHQGTLTSSDTGPWEEGFRKEYHLVNGNQSSGAGAADLAYLYHFIEAQDIANSGWNYTNASSKLTLSFWIKSSVAQNFYGFIKTMDGTAQLLTFETTALTANTWKKVTVSIPGHANLQFDNNAEAGLQLAWMPFFGTDYTTSGKTLNAWGAYSGSDRSPDNTSTWWTTDNATFQLTGVQLEVSDYATEFEHRKFQDELYNCQRYYQQVGTTTQDGQFCIGASHLTSAGDQTRVGYFGQNNLRATPTITEFGDGLRVIGSGSNTPVTGISDINVTFPSAYLQFNAECTDIGDDNEIVVVTNTANGGIKIEAEL